MVFKGSANRTAAEVNRDLDDLSASSNAYTSEEQTVYFATILPDDQEPIVELLADMMRPALRQEDFDTEKKVILEEIAKYDDQPPYGAHEKCMAAFFGEHPLGKSILGTPASVGGLAREPDAGLFRAALQSEKHGPGRRRQCRFRFAYPAGPKLLRPLGHVRRPAAHISPAQPRSTSKSFTSRSPSRNTSCNFRRRPPPPTKTATRHGCSPRSSATTAAAACFGNWSIRARPNPPRSASRSFKVPACSSPGSAACPNWPRKTCSDRRHHPQAEANGVTEEELNQAKNKVCAHIVSASRAAHQPALLQSATPGSSGGSTRPYAKPSRRTDVTLDDIPRPQKVSTQPHRHRRRRSPYRNSRAEQEITHAFIKSEPFG